MSRTRRPDRRRGSARPADLSAFGVEIAPRLFSWEAFHPQWRRRVRSAAYFPGRSVVLIDPMVPPGARRRAVWRELDRLVAREGRPLHIVLTIFYHLRSAGLLLERYGRRAKVWCPAGGRVLKIPSRRFRAGNRLPGGIRTIPTARSYEAVLWIAPLKTLFAGDVILGGKNPPLRLCPQGWLPKGTTRRDLAASIEPTLRLPVAIVHVGHGPTVLSNARESWAAAIRRARKAAKP